MVPRWGWWLSEGKELQQLGRVRRHSKHLVQAVHLQKWCGHARRGGCSEGDMVDTIIEQCHPIKCKESHIGNLNFSSSSIKEVKKKQVRLILSLFLTQYIQILTFQHVININYFIHFSYLLLGGWEREGEKHGCVRDTVIGCCHAPPTGDLTCNPGSDPSGNQNSHLSVHRLAVNPLSHTSQGNRKLMR